MPSLSSFRASLLSISMACAPLLIPTAFAQAAEEASRFPGSIEGWVVDEDGRPVATATVVVLGADLRASTDAGGRFLLLNVPVGSYPLQVQAAGFVEAAVDSVEVIEGEIAEVALQLVALEIPSTPKVKLASTHCSSATNPFFYPVKIQMGLKRSSSAARDFKVASMACFSLATSPICTAPSCKAKT